MMAHLTQCEVKTWLKLEPTVPSRITQQPNLGLSIFGASPEGWRVAVAVAGGVESGRRVQLAALHQHNQANSGGCLQEVCE